MELLHQAISILANPISIPETEYSHPAFGPLTISAIEGLLLGLILWKWTDRQPTIVLFGFLINMVTLALLWSAIKRKEHMWEYDFRMVAMGEILVVIVEALAIVFVVRKFAVISPQRIWLKAFGVSLVLNSLSFFTGTFMGTSPIPEPQGRAMTTPASHSALLASRNFNTNL